MDKKAGCIEKTNNGTNEKDRSVHLPTVGDENKITDDDVDNTKHTEVFDDDKTPPEGTSEHDELSRLKLENATLRQKLANTNLKASAEQQQLRSDIMRLELQLKECDESARYFLDHLEKLLDKRNDEEIELRRENTHLQSSLDEVKKELTKVKHNESEELSRLRTNNTKMDLF